MYVDSIMSSIYLYIHDSIVILVWIACMCVFIYIIDCVLLRQLRQRPIRSTRQRLGRSCLVQPMKPWPDDASSLGNGQSDLIWIKSFGTLQLFVKLSTANQSFFSTPLLWWSVLHATACCLRMDVTYEVRSRVPDQSRSFVWRLPLGISTRIDVHMMYIQRYYTVTQGKAETNSINAMSRTTIQTNTLSAIHHNNWHMSGIKELWFHHVSPTLMSY